MATTKSGISNAPQSKPGYHGAIDSKGQLVQVPNSLGAGTYSTPSGGTVSSKPIKKGGGGGGQPSPTETPSENLPSEGISNYSNLPTNLQKTLSSQQQRYIANKQKGFTVEVRNSGGQLEQTQFIKGGIQNNPYKTENYSKPGTGFVVEQRNAQGELEQTQYIQGDIRNKPSYIQNKPEEQPGKVTHFNIVKNNKGQVIGVQEVRQMEQQAIQNEQPVETLSSTNPNQITNMALAEQNNSQIVSMGLSFPKVNNQTSSFGNSVWTSLLNSRDYGEFFGKVKGNFTESYPDFSSKVMDVGTTIYTKYPITPFGTTLSDIPFARIKETSPLNSPELTVSKITGLNTLGSVDIGQANLPSLLLLGASSGPLGKGNQIFRETIPLRERATPTAVEEIQTNIIEGKVYRESTYNIFTERQPPRITYETSLNQLAMGKKLEVKYLPPVVSKTKTPFKAVAEQEFVTLETKGGTVGTASIVSGSSERLDILNYKNLPSTQKYLVEQLAKVKTGGVPVSQENVIKIISPRSNNMLYLSDIEVEKALKINLQPKAEIINDRIVKQRYSLFQEGKRTTRFQAITETTPKFENDLFEFSTSKVLFKEMPPKESIVKNIIDVPRNIRVRELTKQQMEFLGNEGSLGFTIKKGHEGAIIKVPKRFIEKYNYVGQRKFTLKELGLREGIVYFRKGIKNKLYNEEFVIGHETGHLYSRDIGLDYYSKEYKKSFFKEAETSLKKMYGENIPYTKKEYINEYFATKLRGKVATNPFLVIEETIKPRASGKITQLNVFTREKKEINVISSGEKSNIILPADIEKTPLDVTFQRTIQVQKQPTVFPAPRVPRANVYTKIVSAPLKPSTSLLTGSAYVGMGLYERTEGGQLPQFNNFGSSRSIMTGNVINNQGTIFNENTLTIPKFSLKTFSIETTRTIFNTPQKEIGRNINRGMNKEISKEINKEISKEITKTIQKQTQKQSQKLIQKQTSKITTHPPFFPISKPPRTPPREPPFKLFKLPSAKQSTRTGLFNVFIRRNKIFKPIGTNLQLPKAFSLGEFATQRGLSQTFKLEKVGGGAVDFGTPKGYYKKPSKKGILFIEMPKTKINTASEKWLLKSARSKKTYNPFEIKMKGGYRKNGKKEKESNIFGF